MMGHPGDNDQPTGFDQLMSRMGVRKLEGASKAKGRRRKTHRQQTRATPPSSTPPSSTPPSSTPPSSTPPASTPPAAPQPVALKTPTAPPVRQPGGASSLTQARSPSLASALAAHDDPRAQLAQLQSRLQLAEADNARLSATVDELRGRVASQVSRSSSEPPRLRLSEVLGARGVKGADEAAHLVSALAEARLLPSLVELLQPIEPAALSGFLADRVCLLCGEASCVAPPGRAVLVVPRDRCEVCGGIDVSRSVRRFVDGCLVHALRRVAIVGGPPTAHRQIRDLVSHQAIQVRFLPGDAGLGAASLEGHVDDLDLLVLWSERRPRVGWLQAQDCGIRVVYVAQTDIAHLLEQVAASLLDPQLDAPPQSAQRSS